MEQFLFWLFLAGLLIAVFQDLKRREVDNWLNLLLIFASFGFILYKSVFDFSIQYIILAGFCFVLMFIFSNLFYYARIFAGGDSKLLLAMFAVFIGGSVVSSFINVIFFILLLIFTGAIYGTFWGAVVFLYNFKKCKKRAGYYFKNLYLRFSVLIGVLFFVLSYFNFIYLFFTFVFLVLPVLFVFAKSIDDIAMIKEVSANNLKQGDWLARDIMVGGRVIRADWEGISQKDINFLRKKLSKKKVKIKQGIAFCPVFLISFIIFYFSKEILYYFLL